MSLLCQLKRCPVIASLRRTAFTNFSCTSVYISSRLFWYFYSRLTILVTIASASSCIPCACPLPSNILSSLNIKFPSSK